VRMILGVLGAFVLGIVASVDLRTGS
jgi:hypothetical protein